MFAPINSIYLCQGGPRLRAWRAKLRFEETVAGRKERNSAAIKRLICCSNWSNFCCTANQGCGAGVVRSRRFLGGVGVEESDS